MKERTWTVYRHISPSGKIYIGITSQKPKARWEYGNGYKTSILFYKCILKYGWNNIKHEILFSNLEEKRAKNLEINLIRHYKNLGLSYNITDGGDGTLGLIWTEEMRNNQRNNRIGKKASLETKLKMSNLRKGKYSGKNNPMYNRKHSEETKLKMSISRSGENNWRYGKHITEEERVIFRNAQKSCIKVLQLDKNTEEVINEYSSINEAALAVGGNSSHISECCKGKCKTVKNFKWKYKDEREMQ